MHRTRKWIIVATVGAVAVVGVGTGIAVASDGDEGAEQPITGPALTQATDAALAVTGGKRVVETEVGDEESYYQVEVELANGRHVDVNLDRDFSVVRVRTDDDQGRDADPGR